MRIQYLLPVNPTDPTRSAARSGGRMVTCGSNRGDDCQRVDGQTGLPSWRLMNGIEFKSAASSARLSAEIKVIALTR
jgi:hypothetical protein